MWNREAEWLSKSYTVVRYDLRAHGESDTATTEFTHLTICPRPRCAEDSRRRR
jgi:pimeloyl-ACP methyl ester carboxylesterase